VWPADRQALIPFRYDLFGTASWSGVAATLVIVVLGAVSNDLSLRRLGTGRWKSLQRTNYVLFGLVAVHGLLFQVLEKRVLALVVALGGIVVVTTAVQLGGVYGYRRALRSRSR
jgi:sulfoxide reductase heme-binding subunit YedZ